MPVEIRRLEPTGLRYSWRGNEATVVDMFKAYYKDFREVLYVIGDDNNDEINHRCMYTRDKLVVIDYALNTIEILGLVSYGTYLLLLCR